MYVSKEPLTTQCKKEAFSSNSELIRKNTYKYSPICSLFPSYAVCAFPRNPRKSNIEIFGEITFDYSIFLLNVALLESTHELLVRFRLRQNGTTRSARSRCRSESPGVVRSRSRPESFAVVRSRPESFGIGIGRSQQEPCGLMCL